MKYDIENFRHLIMVYKNNENELFLGHCYQNNGRESAKHLLFLYKEALPKSSFLEAWNYLDDNSYAIVIVEELEAKIGMMDFLTVHEMDSSFENIEYIEIDSFAEIQKNLGDFEKNTVKCFLMK